MFDFQPNLVGNLIELHPAKEADFEDLYAVASDPQIWAQHAIKDRWKRDVFRRNFDDALNDQGGLVALERDSGSIAGFSRYSQLFMGDEEMEIGWTFLAPRFWGGPHNRDMKSIMLEHVLECFPRALFRVAVDNLRSRRAMEKIGGTLIDWQGSVEHRGRAYPHIAYEITRETFSKWSSSDCD